MMARRHTGLLTLAAAFCLAVPAFAQSAPPLSYVQIRYVGSSNQGWEPIADATSTTGLDHGGAQLRVLTVEVGYGTSRVRQNTVDRPRAGRPPR